jgi:hypothetical protein
LADGFCIIKHLYSKFVLYRFRAFNGESGNLNQDTMNMVVNGRKIANKLHDMRLFLTDFEEFMDLY